MSEYGMDTPLKRRLTRVSAVWLALVLLAGLTVATAYIPLGAFNMALNILIAGIKAVLIGAFFMQLAGSYLVPRMVCAIAAVMLVVMFALSGVDYYTRDGKSGRPPAVER